MSLPDRIRTARCLAGLNQTALAARIGVDRSAVSHWERGFGSSPSNSHLLALARIMEVRLEWLAHGTGAMKPCRFPGEQEPVPIHEDYARDQDEERLLRGYRSLSVKRQRALVQRLEQLLAQQETKR